MSEVSLRPMLVLDYSEVFELWQRSEGVGLSASDERDRIEGYMARNPGLSQVAESDGKIVGAVLCGHDGRRGFIYHLAVDSEWRGQGLGRQLAERVLTLLKEQGIQKAYVMVFRQNGAARGFWERTGWEAREDLVPMCAVLE
jgi:ribosomal protein S18 acetylase RimI-like enzyme